LKSSAASTRFSAINLRRRHWDALKDTIVSGWMNKAQVAASGVVPTAILAEMHRKLAEPGTVY
jgi:hypothetical protein